MKVIEGFGGKGFHCETMADLEKAMAEALTSDGPVWIHCCIDKDERCFHDSRRLHLRLHHHGIEKGDNMTKHVISIVVDNNANVMARVSSFLPAAAST